MVAFKKLLSQGAFYCKVKTYNIRVSQQSEDVETALDDCVEEELPFNKKRPPTETQGGEAICHDWLKEKKEKEHSEMKNNKDDRKKLEEGGKMSYLTCSLIHIIVKAVYRKAYFKI